jgi:hypothetical protein
VAGPHAHTVAGLMRHRRPQPRPRGRL